MLLAWICQVLHLIWHGRGLFLDRSQSQQCRIERSPRHGATRSAERTYPNPVTRAENSEVLQLKSGWHAACLICVKLRKTNLLAD